MNADNHDDDDGDAVEMDWKKYHVVEYIIVVHATTAEAEAAAAALAIINLLNYRFFFCFLFFLFFL